MTVAGDLFRLVIAALIISSIAVGLRCWVRIELQRLFGYDDAVLSLSLVGYIIFSAFTFVALHYGYGVVPVEPWHDSDKAIQFFLATQLAYVLTSAVVKTGVALVLFRINVQRPIRHILIVSMTVVWIVALVLFFLLALQCRPTWRYWSVGKGSCVDDTTVRNSGIALSVTDVTSNWLYSFLPIAMLYKVQMGGRIKISVIIILGIGFVSSIATIVRLKYFLEISSGHETDVRELETSLMVILWCHVEIVLAILASSLVAFRPLLRHANEIRDQRRQKGPIDYQRAYGMERPSRVRGDRSFEGGEPIEANGFSSQVAIIKDHPGVVLSDV
ncbi:hypothetical protein F5B20DRAFT_523165 [Whalleya microplaca]|nr:hypothetical protein F5B20DRAFT_523165 [Whalleya microplaca]